MHKVIPLEVQNFTFPFVVLLEIPLGPVLQPVQVPLKGSTTISCTSHSTQFYIMCKLAEGTPAVSFNPLSSAVLPDFTAAPYPS